MKINVFQPNTGEVITIILSISGGLSIYFSKGLASPCPKAITHPGEAVQILAFTISKQKITLKIHSANAM